VARAYAALMAVKRGEDNPVAHLLVVRL
jgi:hypothetical protein